MAERAGLTRRLPTPRSFGPCPKRQVRLGLPSASQSNPAVPADSHRRHSPQKNRRLTAVVLMAERAGFEPAVPLSTHAFQACSFGHSDTSPQISRSRRIYPLFLLGKSDVPFSTVTLRVYRCPAATTIHVMTSWLLTYLGAVVACSKFFEIDMLREARGSLLESDTVPPLYLGTKVANCHC